MYVYMCHILTITQIYIIYSMHTISHLFELEGSLGFVIIVFLLNNNSNRSPEDVVCCLVFSL